MYIWGLIVLSCILMIPINKKKAKAYRKFILDNYGWIVTLGFFLGVFIDIAGFSNEALYNEFISFTAAGIMGLPFIVIRKLLKLKDKDKLKYTEMEREESLEIPDSADGRVRIIRKFNERFALHLTDEEIEKIVNGSFQSKEWAKEIAAMKKNYAIEGEWYSGDTDWVRAYLKAFNVQNVSSDFMLQRDICVQNFNEIFANSNIESFGSVDECIAYINNRYYTNFNDSSFMVAYRFLEENGKSYKLPSMEIIKARDEMEELTAKYDRIDENNMDSVNMFADLTESYNKENEQEEVWNERDRGM